MNREDARRLRATLSRLMAAEALICDVAAEAGSDEHDDLVRVAVTLGTAAFLLRMAVNSHEETKSP